MKGRGVLRTWRMIVTLQTERLRTMEQVRAFVEGSEPVDYKPEDQAARYAFVRKTAVKFDYHLLGRADRGCVRAYIGKVCGFSPAQISRLLRQQAETGVVEDRRARNSGRPFETVYTPADIRRLAAVDEAFGGMSGLATCEILRREFEVHGDARFERLAGISRSHVYNLRASRAYRTRRTTREKTRPSPVAVAVRKAPEPNGRPGFLRVDTVHLGDKDGRKGVYVVNMVDEVTQYEHVGAVPGISERFMVPLLEALLPMFPFDVLGFHADNGSEYVNHRVAALLNKLHVGEFTKSRPRHSNDNALVEGKNAHVVRRHLGTSTSPSASPATWTSSPASTCRRSSTSTAPACSPPSASTPRARRGEPTAGRTWPRRWRSSSRCRTPPASSGTARLSTPSTGPPRRQPACRPPRRSTAPATSCSAKSTARRRRRETRRRVFHRLPTGAFEAKGDRARGKPVENATRAIRRQCSGERNLPTCQSPRGSARPPCVDISKPPFFLKPNEDRVPPACGNQPLVHAHFLIGHYCRRAGSPQPTTVPVCAPATSSREDIGVNDDVHGPPLRLRPSTKP